MPSEHQEQAPEHGRAGGRERQGEHAVHGDDRGDVGEADRGGMPEAELALQLLLVAELAKMDGVGAPRRLDVARPLPDVIHGRSSL